MIDYINEETALRIVFPKQVDTYACEKFREELLEKVHQAESPIIFDMSEVMFISSEFLRICCIVRKDVGPENLSIVRIHPIIYKVFRTAGLAELLCGSSVG